ncbi:hypothetical protein ACFLXD_05045 [Chloroflexota bacterium]
MPTIESVQIRNLLPKPQTVMLCNRGDLIKVNTTRMVGVAGFEPATT